jgi:hypothetical protein
VATIVFLAMIAMIFISAFVLGNGTLCISESPYFLSLSITVSGTLLTEGCSLCRARVPRVPLVHAIVYPLCTHCSPQGVRNGITLSLRHHHAYHFPIRPLSGPLIMFVTSNLFFDFGSLFRATSFLV